MVAPFVGAWIEIKQLETAHILFESLRSSERGLKFKWRIFDKCRKEVAPFVGAWIEIVQQHQGRHKGRSLRSSERGLK